MVRVDQRGSRRVMMYSEAQYRQTVGRALVAKVGSGKSCVRVRWRRRRLQADGYRWCGLMPRWSLLLLIVCAPPLTTAQCTRGGKSVSACLKLSQVSSHAPAGRFERCVYCYKKDTDKDGQCQGCHQCTTKLRRGDLSNCMYWPEQVLEQPAKNLSDKQARDLGRTLRHHEFVAMLSKDQKTDPKPVHPLCYAASCSAEGVPAWLQQVPNMIDPACKQDEPSQPSVEDAGEIDEAVKELQAAATPSAAAAPLASPDPLLLSAPAPAPAPAQPVVQPVDAQPVDT